jgi:hypothetical protein
MIILASCKHFGLVDISKGRLGRKRTPSRELQASKTVIFTTLGTSFHGLRTFFFFPQVI